ncbi:DUF3667 domain-containing protein [Pseudoblastomonas halimionae]|uniref:DUF3667 domain-containing protein n=1 Tax=Alteriqipengyuania halimionae TaxID=1926630 RepID=A0A6I4U4H8_9SPHN|nr:DUF3667 domain-containing protein [Alteriqipengyuania halimionae]MXP10264.1 DUF3667 domain-containing protein [Alteriqipengyuania halimionae]
MSDFGDAIGTATEGGLYSSAVSKDDGTASLSKDGLRGGHFAEEVCLNCGTPLQGPHCHNCGQKVHLHRTIGAFMHDLLHGALHFEGKMWSTLPKLILKPGELTRRYIAGERAKFVSPMAIFLFTVFLMFAVFQALGLSVPADIGGGPDAEEALVEEREDLEGRRAELQTEIAEAETDAERGALESELAELEREINGLDAARALIDGEDMAAVAAVAQGEVSDESASDAGETGSTADGASPETRKASSRGRNKFNLTIGGSDDSPFLEKLQHKWRTNPGLMLYKLQSNSYKFSWLLIPLSIPFVWLLFLWKRDFRAYDHAIFVTYSLAFMSMLFIVLSILGVMGVGPAILASAGAIIPPVHIYKQLRGAYGLSRFSTIWRLAVLLVFIFVVLSLFAYLLFLLGAF